MATLKILVESVDSDELLQSLIDSQKPAAGKDMPDFVPQYLKSLHSGLKPGSVLRYSACEVQASADAVLASVIEDDTLTIGAKLLTAKDAPATQDEFLVGANDAETSDNLAACINANSDLQNWLKAESNGVDTVTLTCLIGGSIGNNILLEADSTITLSADNLEDGEDANNSQETT